jgi:superfamily II DNA or RNA helicase
VNFGGLELKDYQRRPLDTLLQGQRGLLIAHGVGSGKTLTGISIAVNMLHLGQVNDVQIVVPVKLAEQWKNNIRRFVPAK